MSATLISDKLKAALLQSAIQGKLTQQLPEDGDARDLLKQIEAEKARLINEKVIKKEKPLPEITEEETPFDIPDNWVWVRLGKIGVTNIGLTYDKKDISTDGTIILRSGNIQNNRIDLHEIVKINGDIPDNKKCYQGDLLICARNGSRRLVGKSAIIKHDGMSFGAFMALFRSICNPFIHCFLQSPFYRENLDGVSTTTINQITQDNLKQQLIPLPPLKEQYRIVEVIETALAKIDKLKVDETKLYDIQKAFPNKLRASLLQSAIQGKLTQQLPEDGDARDLLKQIEAEKARLINEKVIKKEKPLPEITEDEIPFDIPDNWVWVYLQNIVLGTEAGKSPRCETRHVNFNQWGVLTTTSIQKNLFLEDENKILPNSFLINHAIQVKKQDLLITRAGPTNRTGVACVVRDIKYNLILSDKTVRILYVKNKVNPYYLSLFINSEYGIEQVKDLATGMDKQQVNLSQDKIKSLKIALPPLAEQYRIVEVIETALAKIDKLNKLTE